MESGEAPALDPERSDPGARSSGAVQGHEDGAVCPRSVQRTVLLTLSSGRVTLGRSCASLALRLSSVQTPCSRPFRVGVQTRRRAGGNLQWVKQAIS